MTLSAADRITKSNVWLMGHKPTLAYSGILLVGESHISTDVPTAATNGRDVTYNPDFVESLTDQQLRGLVLHEAGHKMYMHLFLWQSLFKENAELANRATDFVINLGIYDLDPRGKDIALPPDPCLDEKYRGMDSKQIFDLLKQDQQNGGSEGKGQPLDTHQWGDAQELSKEDQQALSKEIDAAIRAGAFLAGKQGGDVSRDFVNLMEPQVDWAEQLRDYLSSVCTGKGNSTWAKPNRRWLYQDIYMPSQVSESIGGIVVGIDTSGSIDQEALTKALTELVGICENVTPERVDLLYWDTRVAGHETYFEGDYASIIQSTKPKGGGGSNSSPVFTYLSEKMQPLPVVCIMITDGYIDYPSAIPPYPVLWVVVGNKYCTLPFGSVIHLS